MGFGSVFEKDVEIILDLVNCPLLYIRVARLSLVVLFAQDALEGLVRVKEELPR